VNPGERVRAWQISVLGICLVSPAWIVARQAAPSGQAQVYLRTAFDDDAPAFKAEGNGTVTFVSGPEALDGRSLMVARKAAGSYFGAQLGGLRIEGSQGLRVAFSVRARGMRTIAINLFDEARSDNTTPASPARIGDTDWRTVVFHVEDFHYNSDEPDRKLGGGERFVGMLFHGQDGTDAPQISIDNLVVYRGPDRTPPAPPSGLQVDLAGADVTLRWTAAADDTMAALYSIYRQTSGSPWIKVGESLRSSFRDQVPAAGGYRYRVTAADYENNLSEPSQAIDVAATTTGTPVPGVVTPVVQDRLGYASHVRDVHERGRASVRPGVFLFAGDSITGAASYTHSLGSWLARGQFIRQGVASVTTDYGAANIRQYLQDGKPEFAVVMYGTNDRGDVRGSMRNLSTVIDACIGAGTVPIVATIPPRGYSKRQGDQESFNRALAELARAKKVPVSYAFEEMMQHDLREILSDGIHLTPEVGNDVAGRALRKTMDQVYYALRDN
jgi:lysophospholipase L1-like esterase